MIINYNLIQANKHLYLQQKDLTVLVKFYQKKKNQIQNKIKSILPNKQEKNLKAIQIKVIFQYYNHSKCHQTLL